MASLLVLTANPIDTQRLDNSEELRACKHAIRDAKYGDDIEIITQEAARPDDVVDAMARYRPNIVHFSGHCTESGDLILTSDSGESVHVSPQDLASALAWLASRLQLIVFNGCRTRAQAEALIDIADCAVATNATITDPTATSFTKNFYRSLAQGRSIQSSFDAGMASVCIHSAANRDLYFLQARVSKLAGQCLVGPAAAVKSSRQPEGAHLHHAHHERSTSSTSTRRHHPTIEPDNEPHRGSDRPNVSAKLRILHLSDVHFRTQGTNPGQSWRRALVLGDEWDKNLSVIQKSGGIDLVCFTGDAAYAGKKLEYEHATLFFDRLLKQLELEPSRLFVVPGNHDIDRSKNANTWKRLRRLASKNLRDLSLWMASHPHELRGSNLIDKLGEVASSHRSEILSRQQAYREWVAHGLGRPTLVPNADRSGHPTLGWRETLNWPGLPSVHLIGLDSAWLCGDDNDDGKLVLTDDQIMLLATDQGRALNGLRIALLHHPLTNLADGVHARRLLARHVDFVLHGHLHDPEARFFIDPSSNLRELAAGCLYEHESYPNSFYVLELELDAAGHPLTGDLWFRAWSPRGHWYDDSPYPACVGGRLRWFDSSSSETLTNF